MRPSRLGLLLAATIYLVSAPSISAQRITSPREHFGFAIGDDYRLANYTQFSAYFEKLARESDRMELDTIGQTAEGRPQLMAIISTPANLARKARYKEISARLARAEGLSEDEVIQAGRS